MSALAALTRTRLKPPAIRSLASVLLVDRIEPCLAFWADRLGFEVTLRVEGEECLDFALLRKDGAEIVLRTRDSFEASTQGLLDIDFGRSGELIFLEVSDFDAVLDRLEGADVVIPERESPFGSREIFVREPSGRIVALTCHI